MLHQTRVETVLPYYERFLRRFPDTGALARARLQTVLKMWEGLGYYGRARNLHRAAKIIIREHGGSLPYDPKTLGRLPGIGVYSVGAIGSIAYDLPLPAVDGNVRRVLSRLFEIESDPAEPGTRRKVDSLAQALVSRGRPPRPGDVNQALMDLGGPNLPPPASQVPALSSPIGLRRPPCRTGGIDHGLHPEADSDRRHGRMHLGAASRERAHGPESRQRPVRGALGTSRRGVHGKFVA